MSNYLKYETSPYLLQHAENPVNWYPWGTEAFEKARKENKPIFLSIGYSTCHWCHVMAHESFEDEEIADLLNKYFVSIKVDREERPDIDSIYMTVCEAFTGNGGWPTSIFMTADQKPFFAGTYFPKTSRYGMGGFRELLSMIHKQWEGSQQELVNSAEEITNQLRSFEKKEGKREENLQDKAVDIFRQTFDGRNGGFGSAPKFPTPHNLLFLMNYYKNTGNEEVLKMVEQTLIQMYRGGIYDQIGFGFSRYSTDALFLVPHFEKMLYDNALLMMAYAQAYQMTGEKIFRRVAEQTAEYVMREMTGPQGGFYSAQDADSEGVEGQYYVFTPEEITEVLGMETGEAFNKQYDITKIGNFEGKSIPNLLKSDYRVDKFFKYFPALLEYRKTRTKLHLDDKILTVWNSLMISAFSWLYQATGEEKYLETAQKAQQFLSENLAEGTDLFVSFRQGKRGGRGYLGDYAFYIMALLSLYDAALQPSYLKQAVKFYDKAAGNFHDSERQGFYLYGKENETLILNPKETYDGALPSGNSVMAYNAVVLSMVLEEGKFQEAAMGQLLFLASEAGQYPVGHSFFLLAEAYYRNPPEHVTVVLGKPEERLELKGKFPLGTFVTVLEKPSAEYPLLNGKITFYVCRNHSCLPPENEYLLQN